MMYFQCNYGGSTGITRMYTLKNYTLWSINIVETMVTKLSVTIPKKALKHEFGLNHLLT